MSENPVSPAPDTEDVEAHLKARIRFDATTSDDEGDGDVEAHLRA